MTNDANVIEVNFNNVDTDEIQTVNIEALTEIDMNASPDEIARMATEAFGEEYVAAVPVDDTIEGEAIEVDTTGKLQDDVLTEPVVIETGASVMHDGHHHHEDELPETRYTVRTPIRTVAQIEAGIPSFYVISPKGDTIALFMTYTGEYGAKSYVDALDLRLGFPAE